MSDPGTQDLFDPPAEQEGVCVGMRRDAPYQFWREARVELDVEIWDQISLM